MPFKCTLFHVLNDDGSNISYSISYMNSLKTLHVILCSLLFLRIQSHFRVRISGIYSVDAIMKINEL